jgi:hypothetical protein
MGAHKCSCACTTVFCEHTNSCAVDDMRMCASPVFLCSQFDFLYARQSSSTMHTSLSSTMCTRNQEDICMHVGIKKIIFGKYFE